MNHIKEKVMEGVFLFTAVISIIAVALICVFLFANGFPAMQKIGVWQFLSGKVWKPTNNIFGIFPMILGSIYVTGGALLIGVPVGILMSIFMSGKTVPHFKTDRGSLSRHPFYCIWIFRSGRIGAVYQRTF